VKPTKDLKAGEIKEEISSETNLSGDNQHNTNSQYFQVMIEVSL
jgi:hypothetical protein